MTEAQMKLFVEHIIESERLRRSWNERIDSWQKMKIESGLWNDEPEQQKEWNFEQL